MAKKSEHKSWTVKMRCVVEKVVTCDDCTEQDAHLHPWDYASDELETDQMDWEVLSVEENT